MKKINRNMRGFTLVEIMIVVAIILIISAVAFTGVAVTLSNAQEKQAAIEDHADNFEIAARTQIKNLEAGVVDWSAIPKYTPKKKADREVAALKAFGWKDEEIEVTYGETGYVITKTWNPDLHDGKTYDEYVAEKNKTNTPTGNNPTANTPTDPKDPVTDPVVDPVGEQPKVDPVVPTTTQSSGSNAAGSSFEYNNAWSGNQEVTVKFNNSAKSFIVCVPGYESLDIDAYGNTNNIENLGNGQYRITPKWNTTEFKFRMSGSTLEEKPDFYVVSYESA